MDKDAVQDLISLRQDYRDKDTKDYSRAKKKRLVATAVLNSIIAVPDNVREKLKELWKDIPPHMTTQEVIICQRAYNAITDGKDALRDAQFLMNTAFGLDSVDSEVSNTYVLPDITPEMISKINSQLNNEY